GRETATGKVDVFNRFAGFVKKLLQLERDNVESGSDSPQHVGRQRSQKLVGRRRSIGRGQSAPGDRGNPFSPPYWRAFSEEAVAGQALPYSGRGSGRPLGS